MKKVLIGGSVLIIGLVSSVYAVNINLSINKTQSDINKPITLKLEINNDKDDMIKNVGIQGLNNFDIVGQQQFQSSSSSIVIVNGQQKMKTNIVQTLMLVLKAKKAGTYTIGPAIVKIGNKEYKSNSVNVKITGARIMIGNSQNSIQQLQQQNNKSSPSIPQNNKSSPSIPQNTNSVQTQKTQTENKTIQAEKLGQNNNELILFIVGILLLIGTGITIYVLKNNEMKENNEIKENNDFKKDNEEIISPNTKPETKIETSLSFLEKYGIEKPETKTYSEIMQEVKEKNINLTDNEKELIKKELIDKFRQ